MGPYPLLLMTAYDRLWEMRSHCLQLRIDCRVQNYSNGASNAWSHRWLCFKSEGHKTNQKKKKMGMLKKIVRKGFRRMGRLVMKGGRGNNQYISYICEIYTKLNRFN